jgi:hypothetical protein
MRQIRVDRVSRAENAGGEETPGERSSIGSTTVGAGHTLKERASLRADGHQTISWESWFEAGRPQGLGNGEEGSLNQYGGTVSGE